MKNSVLNVVGAGSLSWQTVLLYHRTGVNAAIAGVLLIAEERTSYPGWLTSILMKSGWTAGGDTIIE